MEEIFSDSMEMIKHGSWNAVFMRLGRFFLCETLHINFNLNVRVFKLKLGYKIILKIKSEKFNRNLIKL